MDEKVHFVSRLLDGERMVDLCREFGISRKTGYKFWERYQKAGIEGLSDQLRRPLHIPHQTPAELETLIFKLRKSKPTWGPKKLKARLEQLHPGIVFPAPSTIGEILKRNGYIELRRRSKKANYFPSTLTPSRSPNEVWCVDFKGQFRLGNGKLCYPLTITDHYSRFLICCEALEDVRTESAFPAFEAVFQEFGLPKIIRSDNGVPFSSPGLAGISRLSAWWMRLGIRPERIEPGHPEQNGRHERMHLTLKKEATRPAGKNILQQQEKFDDFRHCYNLERPHEALEMKTPRDLYHASKLPFSGIMPEPDYATYDAVRKVMSTGTIRVPKTQNHCFIGRALQGHPLGLREVSHQIWLVNFAGTELGYISAREDRYTLTTDHPLAPPED